MIDHPRVLCIVLAVAMWCMSRIGVWLRGVYPPNDKQDSSSISIVVSASLTLLGLIISFTFSMAATRYDQRKLYEEGEANAIGTEFVRADLLPAAQVAPAKALLMQYCDWRINFYQNDYGKLNRVDTETARFQAALWRSIQPDANAQPTSVTALVVSGMNDVLNSQGYTQFSWWNRIPTSAWGLLVLIALFANVLVGYATERTRSGTLLLFVLPLLVAVSFFLIADIDSPRGGIIRIQPKDLVSLSQSMHHPAP